MVSRHAPRGLATAMVSFAASRVKKNNPPITPYRRATRPDIARRNPRGPVSPASAPPWIVTWLFRRVALWVAVRNANGSDTLRAGLSACDVEQDRAQLVWMGEVRQV
jgi:hypothetical protein